MGVKIVESISLVSRAKINLTLEVSGKRPDGYHDLDSIVQVIDISDELTISKTGAAIEVISDNPNAPSGPDNIIYKACEAFFQATNIKSGAKCSLTKRIPVQAGLGGGSGNAAAAIIGLNELYGCGLSNDKLAELAAKVGSDAPLFIFGGTARMRGRGDQIEALPDAPEMQLVIIKPEVGVSTAWAYGELDKSNDRPCLGASNIVEKAIRAQDRDAIIQNLCNDFDPIVTAAFDEISKAKRLLLEIGAGAAMLSGSGSAVFGIFDSKQGAESAAEIIRNSFADTCVTRSLERADC